MEKLINFFKTHWVLLALLLLFLFLLPTLPFVLWYAGKKLVELAGRTLGQTVGATVATAFGAAYNLLTVHPFIFSLIVSIILPPVGFVMTVWLILDGWKTGPDLKTVTPQDAIAVPPATGTTADFSQFLGAS